MSETLLQKLTVVAAISLLAACEKIEQTTYSPPYEAEEEVSCHYTGSCYACAPEFSLFGDETFDIKCKYRYSAQCEGKQKAKVYRHLRTDHYESGKSKSYVVPADKPDEPLEECHE